MMINSPSPKVFKVVVAFLLVNALYFSLEAWFSGSSQAKDLQSSKRQEAMSPKTKLEIIVRFCRSRHPNPDQTQDEVQLILDVFMQERRRGLSIEQVASDVFNVTLPNQNTKFSHSYPLLTGDTLLAYSDHVFESDAVITTATKDSFFRRLKEGDVIFVKPDVLNNFIRKILPKIRSKFILITHNSDYVVPDRIPLARNILLKNPYLIRWFAKNPTIYHPKMEAIAIGLMSRRFEKYTNIEDFETAFSSPTPPIYEPDRKGRAIGKANSNDLRPILSYINFVEGHNKAKRGQAIGTFRDISLSKATNPKLLLEYLKDLKRTKFVVSPPGSGEDCYRTWEAILFNAIPIVSNSTLWPLFKESPVYILNDWTTHVEEQQLLNFQVSSKNRKLLLAQYWFDRIDSFRPQNNS